ncbi:hypothetical protein DSECCO2_570290 [anaerobic digester metagenome]
MGGGEQRLDVRVGEGDGRGGEEAGQAGHGEQRGEGHGRCREKRQGEADQRVAAGFEQQPGQDETAGRGRFGVGVGQPHVHRHERNLDGEREHEGGKEPAAGRDGQLQAREVEKREGRPARQVGGKNAERDDGQEHEQPAHGGKEEEFDGYAHALAVPEHADEEKDRDELRFPEKREQEHVRRQEHALHRGERGEDERVVERRARGVVVARGEHAAHADKGREHDEDEA